jgi:spermidine/putrescine transport system permease protein
VKRTSKLFQIGWLPLVWYIFFLIGPLLLVLATSFASRGTYGGIQWLFSLENFSRSLDPLYAKVFFRSLWLATATSAFTFAVGFPTALIMATSTHKVRNALVLLMAIPFLTNLIIRICALKVITAVGGPLSLTLQALHIPHDPFALSQNLPLVMIGMGSTYLPFMVFPIYGALERFDFSLIDAALDLGATYTQVICKVLLPNLRKGIASALLLVFIPSLGDFVIPDLLGGAKTMLNGNLISEQFLKARDWPFGSALSVVLMALLAVVVFLISRFSEDPAPPAKEAS